MNVGIALSLLVVLIGLIGFFMSLYFKKGKTVLGAMILVFLVGGFFTYRLQFTTFEKYAEKYLNENSIVDKVSITLIEIKNDFPDRTAKAEIEDEGIINQLLEDFSKIEMKKDYNAKASSMYGDYYVEFLTTNEREGILETETFAFMLDKDSLEDYQIVSDTEHLKTIQSLEENGEIEWKEY